MDKQSLRDYAKKIRKNIDSSLINPLICENIKKLKEFQDSKNVMIYYPFGSELNILELLENKKKSWILPKVKGNELEIYFYKKGDPLVRNQWRIKEPYLDEKKAEKRELNMVILPGLCADKRGFRLGYGLGYYDRFIRELPKNCIRIIPVISELLLDEVPKDLWDEPANIVITEKEILRINS